MNRILIDQDISAWWGISASSIREQLDQFKPGDSVEIIIHSAGGSVFEGIPIFNMIKDAAKSLALTVTIQGLAASMAGYIAIAAKIGNKASVVRAEKNAMFMVHNPWFIAIGDYHEMKNSADFLERMTELLSDAYVTASGKTEAEIRAIMDAETWYFGEEIRDAGFVDQIIDGDTEESVAPTNKQAALAMSRVAMEQTKSRLREKPEGMDRAVALMASISGNRANGAPLARTAETSPQERKLENNTQTEKDMNLEELKAKYPELFALVFAQGVESERKRVLAHLKMGETAKSLETSAKFIRDGAKLSDDEVLAEYHSLNMRAVAGANRAADNLPPFGQQSEKDGRDQMLAALDAGLKLGKESLDE